MNTQTTTALPLIVCYGLNHPGMPDGVADKLINDLPCRILCCKSWELLMSTILRSAECPALVILGKSIFNISDTSMNEIIDAIHTLHKCAYSNSNTVLPIAVVVDTNCTPDFVKRLKQSSVSGIIPGVTFGYDGVIRAIRELITHHTYWPLRELGVVHLTCDKPIKTASSAIKITHRQEDVLSLVCNRGLSNKKIASLLHITESTVKIHMSAILKSYGVRNRTQLVLAVKSSLKA